MTAPATIAYARHGHGYDVYRGKVETTFMFSDEAMTRPLGWKNGWIADGSTWGDFGDTYRVRLVGLGQAGAGEDEKVARDHPSADAGAPQPRARPDLNTSMEAA